MVSTTLSLIRKAMFIDQRFLKRVWKLSTGERSISTVPGADIANMNQKDDDKKSDRATEIVHSVQLRNEVTLFFLEQRSSRPLQFKTLYCNKRCNATYNCGTTQIYFTSFYSLIVRTIATASIAKQTHALLAASLTIHSPTSKFYQQWTVFALYERWPLWLSAETCPIFSRPRTRLPAWERPSTPTPRLVCICLSHFDLLPLSISTWRVCGAVKFISKSLCVTEVVLNGVFLFTGAANPTYLKESGDNVITLGALGVTGLGIVFILKGIWNMAYGTNKK